MADRAQKKKEGMRAEPGRQIVTKPQRLAVAVEAVAGRIDMQQSAICEWMRDVISRRNISASAWAEMAGLGKNTVSRALRPDYAHITTTRTVAKLAQAIGERPPGGGAGIPGVTSLAAMLEAFLMALVVDRPPSPDVLEAFAQGLRETLLQLADDPDAGDDPKMSRLLARAIARRTSSTISRLSDRASQF